MPAKTSRSAKPASLKPILAEIATPLDIRTGLGPRDIATCLLDNLRYVQGRFPQFATRNDWYMALAYTVRDRLLERWMRTMDHLSTHVRTVSYLSAEFLVGPHLANTMANLGITENVRQACHQLGQ
ncbi:MAG: glycogen phosphorylase, partial [Tepidisphaerales bacterium]